MTKIFYFTTVDRTVVGGAKAQFQHVAILRRNGFDAWVVSQNMATIPGWFEHTAPVISLQEFLRTCLPQDWAVFPEVCGREPNYPGRKVIFNQNVYKSFQGYGIELNPRSIYSSPQLEVIMVSSKDNERFMRYALAGKRILRIKNAVNPEIFKPAGPKKKKIAFFLRKNFDEVECLINLLLLRGSLTGWELAPIKDKTEAQVAEILSDSAVYLHFGYPEGLCLSVLEAMNCGCYIVGYHGFGDIEYMKKEFSSSIDCADVYTFALETERILQEFAKSPQLVLDKAEKGRNFILDHYSVRDQENDVLAAWKKILRIKQAHS